VLLHVFVSVCARMYVCECVGVLVCVCVCHQCSVYTFVAGQQDGCIVMFKLTSFKWKNLEAFLKLHHSYFSMGAFTLSSLLHYCCAFAAQDEYLECHSA
jgi:hypothetical protein